MLTRLVSRLLQILLLLLDMLPLKVFILLLADDVELILHILH
jgi:hypothetical protein